MKKTWKYAIAAFTLFAFTACGGTEDTTESDTMETDDVEMDTDMSGELEEDTTIVVEDTTINDGVADEIQEEQPPVQ